MELFETSAITLSMKSSMGEQLTANVYTVEGIYKTDGTLRELSIGQLVMAICLNRATKMEEEVVSLMELLARQSANIEALSAVQVAALKKTQTDTCTGEDFVTDSAVTCYDLSKPGADPFTGDAAGTIMVTAGLPESDWKGKTYEEVVKLIDNKLDQLNSFSQETLIDIQSKTSKRDDTYNLITNMLKSLNTTLVGNANNL